MKILHLDSNHPLLINQLNTLGFTNHEDYESSKALIEKKIKAYDGVIIRSRFPIDRQFLKVATNLKFIGRVGAGLENIDVDFAHQMGVQLLSAPEGNRNAVAEHALGMLLSLFNKFNQANAEVKRGVWHREANRGVELDGKTVGIIGYGNMGKAFARKLQGFDVAVICYDIKAHVGDRYAQQVDLDVFRERVDVVSLHTPQTPLTLHMIDASFIEAFKKPFWFINTARGRSVVTADLVEALKSGKVLGAGLDVLEYENASFENLFASELPAAFKYLRQAENVLLTPHVAGWTVESKAKLAQVIVDKIKANYCEI